MCRFSKFAKEFHIIRYIAYITRIYIAIIAAYTYSIQVYRDKVFLSYYR